MAKPFRANLARILVPVLVWCLAPARAPTQESQDTFFDQEAFNTCEGFLAARTHPEGVEAGRYAAWADGYLTAAAEDASLRRYAARTGTAARALAWLAAFCTARPLESFYAAVAGLAQAWRRGPAP